VAISWEAICKNFNDGFARLLKPYQDSRLSIHGLEAIDDSVVASIDSHDWS
jgi:hypothetical protein